MDSNIINAGGRRERLATLFQGALQKLHFMIFCIWRYLANVPRLRKEAS